MTHLLTLQASVCHSLQTSLRSPAPCTPSPCPPITTLAPLLRPVSRRYDAIIDLTRQLNRRYPTARETQLTTRGILNSLFPSWLPGAFKVIIIIIMTLHRI